MSWDVELAKQFKSRNNKNPIEPQLGEVISSSPIKIAILSNKIILDNENCYICSSSQSITPGDKVLCLPTSDGQTFFIVDKVV